MFYLKYIHQLLLILLHTVLLRSCFILFFGLSIKNRKALQQHKQFVLIANHNSHLDALVLLTSLPPSKLRNISVIGAADYFGVSPFVRLLARLCCKTVLINRSRKGASQTCCPIQRVKAELEKGNSIIFFPEGSRGRAEVMAPFKKGIGHIMKDYKHIPVVVAYTEGLGKCLPKGSYWLLPFQASIVFSQAFYCEADDPKIITQRLWEELMRLKVANGSDKEMKGLDLAERQIGFTSFLDQSNKNMFSKAS